MTLECPVFGKDEDIEDQLGHLKLLVLRDLFRERSTCEPNVSDKLANALCNEIDQIKVIEICERVKRPW